MHTPSSPAENASNEKLLSVIIPAYNVAPYIEACIQSVLSQPECNRVQAIVVVDGATDDTLAIAERAASGHEDTVTIIARPNNGGLSVARNTGLEIVTTEYVAFLDGDDIWLPNYLHRILPMLAEHSPDIVAYDAQLMDEQGTLLKPLKISGVPENTIEKTDKYQFLSLFRCYTWARVYRTYLVQKTPFPPNRRFEDNLTTPYYVWESKNMISVGIALYGYRQRSGSILATPNPRDVEDLSFGTDLAASMYKKTNDVFWKLTAHRIFQQACRRITWQPFSTWPASLRIACEAIDDVPPLPGLVRWIHVHATPFYVALLYVKRIITGH
jgi:glycosyltransferase involved in cell wall biosynthesis